MPKINFKYKLLPANEKYGEGFTFYSLSQKEFDSFNPEILGLGNLSLDGSYHNALAAFFDLKGFTDFCNQMDSQLVIPEFIRRYTDWLFNAIAVCFTESVEDNRVKIWGSLPFYAKFLGDGILFLWNTDHSGTFSGIINIASKLVDITEKYQDEFIPDIKKHVSKPPAALRCGIARGQIISLGNGEDYVGSCINMAARLQKVSLLTFAISRRGFDLSKIPKKLPFQQRLILKKLYIRGIGENELVYVSKSEFEALPKIEKKIFKDPE
jgi:hypothetical protein